VLVAARRARISAPVSMSAAGEAVKQVGVVDASRRGAAGTWEKVRGENRKRSDVFN